MRRILLLSSVLPSVLGAVGCNNDSVGGELLVVRADGSEQVFEPNDCASGEPLEFFGVDMWDGGGRSLRFLHDPDDGPFLAFTTPVSGGPEFTFDPQSCHVFEGELKRTNSQTNGVWEMRGDISLACDTSTGAWVEGALDFEDCADINNDYSSD